MDGLITYSGKRYAFVTPLIGAPGATERVFLHISQCPGRVIPPVGARIAFTVVRGDRGPQAAAVQLKKLSGNRLVERNI